MGHAQTTKRKTNKVNTPDDESGSRLVHTPIYAVANGGHGSSVEYQRGALLISLKIKSR